MCNGILNKQPIILIVIRSIIEIENRPDDITPNQCSWEARRVIHRDPRMPLSHNQSHLLRPAAVTKSFICVPYSMRLKDRTPLS